MITSYEMMVSHFTNTNQNREQLPLTSSNWTQNNIRHMLMKIQILACKRHNNVAC